MNVTVPVGVPPEPVTVAVKVAAPPESDGFCDEVSVVVLEIAGGSATKV
jgi:hypothetical protein